MSMSASYKSKIVNRLDVRAVFNTRGTKLSGGMPPKGKSSVSNLSINLVMLTLFVSGVYQLNQGVQLSDGEFDSIASYTGTL